MPPHRESAQTHSVVGATRPCRPARGAILAALFAAIALMAGIRAYRPAPASGGARGTGAAVQQKATGTDMGGQIVQAIQTAEAARTFAAPVVVRAARFSDGSVEVSFSRPLVDAMPIANLPKTEALGSVTFPASGGPPRVRAYYHAASTPDAAEKARAAAAACSYLRRQGGLRDLFQVTVRARRDGYTVLVQDVPYTSDGFSAVELTRDLRLARITPGE